jgi:hypothetical protein
MTHLSDRALLVQLNVSQWAARKLDKKATKQVADTNYASKDAGNYNKKLLPMSDSLANIHTMTGDIRREFYTNTLPWGLEGTHMLPTSNYLAFMTEFRKRRSDWDNVVRKFLTDYPSLQHSAQRFLGNLYDPADYPDVSELKAKFKMDLVVMPVPTNDFRVQLADDELAGIHADIQRRVEESSGLAMKEAWRRLYDHVKLMAERLANTEGRLYESLFDNALELCRILPRLNFTDDPHLEAMRQEVEAKLANHTKDSVKDNPVLRKQVADEAAAIMARMGAFMSAA